MRRPRTLSENRLIYCGSLIGHIFRSFDQAAGKRSVQTDIVDSYDITGMAKTCISLAELVSVLPLHHAVAIRYGFVRATLEKAGMPIGANDLWLAGHALAEDAILVSNNFRGFCRVPGLKVENWVDDCQKFAPQVPAARRCRH